MLRWKQTRSEIPSRHTPGHTATHKTHCQQSPSKPSEIVVDQECAGGRGPQVYLRQLRRVEGIRRRLRRQPSFPHLASAQRCRNRDMGPACHIVFASDRLCSIAVQHLLSFAVPRDLFRPSTFGLPAPSNPLKYFPLSCNNHAEERGQPTLGCSYCSRVGAPTGLGALVRSISEPCCGDRRGRRA